MTATPFHFPCGTAPPDPVHDAPFLVQDLRRRLFSEPSGRPKPRPKPRPPAPCPPNSGYPRPV
eukprot:1280295-Pyramimonas_sp.AAC.1